MKKAFSLVELLIVVAILGILTAIALPVFQSHTQQAKEAAAKDNLRILRNVIEFYAAQHDSIPPGYPNNNPTLSPTSHAFSIQMIGTGKYLSELPANPFSGYREIKFVDNNEDFPLEPPGTHLFGWLYKPTTKTIKLIWPGTDLAGIAYFDY